MSPNTWIIVGVVFFVVILFLVVVIAFICRRHRRYQVYHCFGCFSLYAIVASDFVEILRYWYFAYAAVLLLAVADWLSSIFSNFQNFVLNEFTPLALTICRDKLWLENGFKALSVWLVLKVCRPAQSVTWNCNQIWYCTINFLRFSKADLLWFFLCLYWWSATKGIVFFGCLSVCPSSICDKVC